MPISCSTPTRSQHILHCYFSRGPIWGKRTMCTLAPLALSLSLDTAFRFNTIYITLVSFFCLVSIFLIIDALWEDIPHNVTLLPYADLWKCLTPFGLCAYLRLVWTEAQYINYNRHFWEMARDYISSLKLDASSPATSSDRQSAGWYCARGRNLLDLKVSGCVN